MDSKIIEALIPKFTSGDTSENYNYISIDQKGDSNKMKMVKRETPMELVTENRIDQIVKEIGLENLLKLSDMFGGDHFYIPKRDSLLRPIRNEQICQEFDGRNHLELSKKYGVSVNTIRQIDRKSVV